MGPDAAATLASVRRGAPDLRALLTRLTALSPNLIKTSEQAGGQLACIRPYTPEIVAFVVNWAGFFTAVDGRDHYLRAQVQQLTQAPVNASPFDAAEASRLLPRMSFGFPAPPGTGAAQPWFQPQCGAGEEGLDPSKDPESPRNRTAKTTGSKR